MELRLKNPELERFVEKQVEAGIFPSVDALLEEAIARLKQDEESPQVSDEDWAAIAEADVEFERGEYMEADEVKAKLRQEFGIK
jgi:Arc/MetJ-type ribon-helix-helix transcriptional regulator